MVGWTEVGTVGWILLAWTEVWALAGFFMVVWTEVGTVGWILWWCGLK